MEGCKNNTRKFNGEFGEYKAVCFDLDGTLLPMDIDEFMAAYFKRIAAFMAAHGKDPEKFMVALKAGTKKMALHDECDDDTNEDAFWREFLRVYGVQGENAGRGENAGKGQNAAQGQNQGQEVAPNAAQTATQEAVELRRLADEFYDKDFPHIGDGFKPNPAAARVVNKLAEKGYPLALTTMPMFPRRAVEHRLAWAGVNPDAFARITSYENSKHVKPKLTYYAENLAALGVSFGGDVLMVGNNTMEDMAFLDLGADGFLVTDYLLDPVDYDMGSIKHGSMDQFEKWVDDLPECRNPAKNISNDAVAAKDMQRALEANVPAGVNFEDANAKAALVADAIAGDHKPGSAGRLKVNQG